MTTDKGNKVRNLASQYLNSHNPTGWFEELYSSAQGNLEAIPWANLTVNPHLAAWIKQRKINGTGKTALVVGCGLGDDAEALNDLGFQVVGFDVSPSAISWCQQRFPNSMVSYCVDDLLRPQVLVKRQFDFVLEAYTLQALPDSVRHQAIATIAQFIAPGGSLLVICRGRDADEPQGELPWPLTKAELTYFEELGLKQVKFADYIKQENSPVRRFRVEYRNTVG